MWFLKYSRKRHYPFQKVDIQWNPSKCRINVPGVLRQLVRLRHLVELNLIWMYGFRPATFATFTEVTTLSEATLRGVSLYLQILFVSRLIVSTACTPAFFNQRHFVKIFNFLLFFFLISIEQYGHIWYQNDENEMFYQMTGFIFKNIYMRIFCESFS